MDTENIKIQIKTFFGLEQILAEEIKKLIGKVERAGYTLMPLNLHYQRGRIKCEIGLAKGKKQHDKRDTERSRDADREIAKALKQNRR